MLEYLGSKETLTAWQGRTIEERTALFNARYAPVKVSTTTLLNAYRGLGIKKKKVREDKVVPSKKKYLIPRQIRFARDALKKALDEGTPVVYLDETMFTIKTREEHEWSAKLHNFKVNQFDLAIKTQAFIGGI